MIRNSKGFQFLWNNFGVKINSMFGFIELPGNSNDWRSPLSDDKRNVVRFQVHQLLTFVDDVVVIDFMIFSSSWKKEEEE